MSSNVKQGKTRAVKEGCVTECSTPKPSGAHMVSSQGKFYVCQGLRMVRLDRFDVQ